MKTRTFTLGLNEASNLSIAGLINRHMSDRRLGKIEVRYSTHTPEVSHVGIQEKLRALAKRQPLPKIDFSCRPHDNALDDALGETHVRLIYNEVAGGQACGWKSWLGSLFTKTPAKSEVALIKENNTVVAEIRLVLKNSLSTWAHAHRRQGVPIAHVAVVSREEKIDRLLGQMERNALANWFRHQIESAGSPVGERFSASYQFRPYRAEQGTDMLGGGDIEIELLEIAPEPRLDTVASRQAETIVLSAQQHVGAKDDKETVPKPAPVSTLSAVHGTLPPDWEESSPYALVVRIVQPALPEGLGTIRLNGLPATINRDLLQSLGLGKHAPVASLVASNSTPLEVDVTPAGRLHLKARSRRDLGTPMYYLPDGRGIVGDLQWQGSAARVIVNAPQGVRDPVHGHLEPIILELAVEPSQTALSVEVAA